MNYGQLKTEWQNRLGITDDLDAILPGLVNEGLRSISNRAFFDFYKAHDTAPVVAELTTGTVTVTNGSATVTFTSAPGSGAIGQLFAVDSTTSWYILEDVSGTSGTLSSAYTGTTASGSSYHIWYWRVDLPSDYSKGSLKQVLLASPAGELPTVFEDVWQRNIADPTLSPGTPSVTFETGDYIYLHPVPTAANNLFIKYYRNPTMLDSPVAATAIDLPAQYHDVILHYCLFNHAHGIRDTLAAAWRNMFEQGVANMTGRHGMKHSMRIRCRPWRARIGSGSFVVSGLLGSS